MAGRTGFLQSVFLIRIYQPFPSFPRSIAFDLFLLMPRSLLESPPKHGTLHTMTRIITISPVTRIEGHARITIRLADAGKVAAARLHVQEFRGFEAFCAGRPFWEMPAITSRICGICPTSHALASALAGDSILDITPPMAAQRLRHLLSLAQLILSHSLSFFHLSAPDIILGLDCDLVERNILGLAQRFPELMRKGIRLRQIGQEIVNRVGGGHLHPENIVAGGMREPLTGEDRDTLAVLLPEAKSLVLFALEIWHEHKGRFMEELGNCGDFPSLFLGLVGADGCLDYTAGQLRFAAADGTVVNEFAPEDYAKTISETITGDSYMKPTSCTLAENGLYRAGPLARLNVAQFGGAPQAGMERERMLAGEKGATDSRDYHHARLIEMLYAVEKIAELLDDPGITDSHVLAQGHVAGSGGVGVTEAPRGTLIHDYRVDQHGLLTSVNLLVATGHNSRAMDQTITDIARRHIRGDVLTEGVLNRVEHGIRLYDPCLSCATHVGGRMGIAVELQDCELAVIDRKTM